MSDRKFFSFVSMLVIVVAFVVFKGTTGVNPVDYFMGSQMDSSANAQNSGLTANDLKILSCLRQPHIKVIQHNLPPDGSPSPVGSFAKFWKIENICSGIEDWSRLELQRLFGPYEYEKLEVYKEPNAGGKEDLVIKATYNLPANRPHDMLYIYEPSINGYRTGKIFTMQFGNRNTPQEYVSAEYDMGWSSLKVIVNSPDAPTLVTYDDTAKITKVLETFIVENTGTQTVENITILNLVDKEAGIGVYSQLTNTASFTLKPGDKMQVTVVTTLPYGINQNYAFSVFSLEHATPYGYVEEGMPLISYILLTP